MNFYSINEISKQLNKAYPFINRKVSDLLKNNILRKVTVGKSHLCSLNLANEKTRLMLSELELSKKELIESDAEYKKKIEVIHAFIEKDNFYTNIHCVLLAGKYTVFIISDLKHRHEIYSKFTDVIVIDPTELGEFFLSTKEAFLDNTVIYGAPKFFEFVGQNEDLLKLNFSPLKFG